MRNILPTLFTALFCLISVGAAAQVATAGGGFCGTLGKSEWLEKYQAGVYPRGQKSASLQYVPMNVVILGDDDGLGYVDPVIFLESLELLNEDFAAQNVRFFISGDIKFVNSSRYYRHDRNTGEEMRRVNNVDFHVNVYIVESAIGNCGYYSSASEGVVLQKDCINNGDRTWSHELGHYLSLPHTFFGWETRETLDNVDFDSPAPDFLSFGSTRVNVEKTDGSNCENAADGFCDTPPDYLMVRWRCEGNGFYRDSLLDPDSTRFAVFGRNIMSYASDNCVEVFSAEQEGAMAANLQSRRGLISTATPDTVGAEPGDLTLLSPEDGTRLQYEDNVTLSWSGVPNADFYVVQVNNRARFTGAVQFSYLTTDTSLTITEGLVRRRDYYWRVRPVNNYVVSGDFGEQIFEFRNGSEAVSTIDPALDAAVSVFPNPASAGTQLRIIGRDLGLSGRLSYQLMDASGRVMTGREGVQVGEAGFNERIATGNLPAGMYFLRLRLDDRLVSRRIIVTP